MNLFWLRMSYSSGLSGGPRDRTQIPEEYKWDLTDLYPDDDAWARAKDQLVSEFAAIEDFRGRLAESPRTLLECLDFLSRFGKEFMRLYCYASMHFDEDTRNTTYLGMGQQMRQIGSDVAAKTAFLQPEILRMGRDAVEAFLANEPSLEIYRHGLDDVLRRKEHTRGEEEERIIADAGLMADAPSSIYTIFSNADFSYPEVVLSDGKKVRVDKASFNLYRAARDREDRRKVFAAYFGSLNDFRRTFGAGLYAEVKKNIFFMKARRYDSCLEKSLDGGNIPLAVYHTLVENVNAHLDTFHRYLLLRKKLLGVDTLHHYDLYAPIVSDVDIQFSIEECKERILTSLAPLGREYVDVATRGFNERWVDVYPTEGKRSGAYSNGAAYDVHPYMLLNYNGRYEDVSTLAHELGHAMHSYLANKYQPYPTSEYSIFVAEVASTFGEALLMDHMLKTARDNSVRLSLLGNYLDSIRGTVFRQTQFSEFELRIHEKAEKGESLTGDSFSELYDEIGKKYYGDDKGICSADGEMRSEWANVPHFYYNFYVYQYATSFTASVALSEQVLAGDSDTTRRYLELLSAGGSDYPINLLRKAGVDMTTSLPFELAMKKMNRVMDEMEGILSKTAATGETRRRIGG